MDMVMEKNMLFMKKFKVYKHSSRYLLMQTLLINFQRKVYSLKDSTDGWLEDGTQEWTMFSRMIKLINILHITGSLHILCKKFIHIMLLIFVIAFRASGFYK